jgi:hypothetical protein
MTKVGFMNLAHVIEDACTDPDCEIHNITVGLDEETVSGTDMAFYLAGVKAAHEGLTFSEAVRIITGRL